MEHTKETPIRLSFFGAHPVGRARRTTERKWYSVREVAEMFGVTGGTIRSWIDKEQLPAMKITRKVTRGRYDTPATTIRLDIERVKAWADKRTS